jgi:hypothetical protein
VQSNGLPGFMICWEFDSLSKYSFLKDSDPYLVSQVCIQAGTYMYAKSKSVT